MLLRYANETGQDHPASAATKGTDAAQLARRARIHPSQLSNLENEKAPPPRDYLKYELLAEALGAGVEDLWRIGQQDRREWMAYDNLRKAQVLSPKIGGFQAVPLLPEIPLSAPEDPREHFESIAEQYCICHMETDPQAFFWRAKDRAMEPEIRQNDLILLSPRESKNVRDGDIAAIANNRGEVYIRRLTVRHDEYVLTPENAAYPVLVWKIDRDSPRIVGRVKMIVRER